MSDLYTPAIPPKVRTAVYYAGVAVGAVSIITSNLVEGGAALLIANLGTAVGSVAAALGVAYRPTTHTVLPPTGRHSTDQ